MWRSYQSGRFRYQRTWVRIQSSASFIEHLFSVNFCRKDENNEKEAGNGPFFKKENTNTWPQCKFRPNFCTAKVMNYFYNFYCCALGSDWRQCSLGEIELADVASMWNWVKVVMPHYVWKIRSTIIGKHLLTLKFRKENWKCDYELIIAKTCHDNVKIFIADLLWS